MGPGAYSRLSFCLLIWLASGNPVEAGEESVPPGEEREDLTYLHAEYQLLRNQLCNENWKSHGFYCYRYFDTPRTFSEAEAECQGYGQHGHLASIVSPADSVFLADLAENANYDIWIGLRNTEGCNSWAWTDATPFNPAYTPWAEWQPNSCNSEQVCVQLIHASKYSKWNDVGCHSRSGYICEIPAGL
ncbi:C-type lectin lectoxin-Phi1-like [Eublepharis macularius]|uniref:C-type lectin lectoxin-Phi1-like n=1 Tax=Eublepharis macularius TaxID=481883 RepID=A0AA97L8V7_EUBMA|nr:C-type lectin lectoxin-Phi1-like [Eublepharis macularius]